MSDEKRTPSLPEDAASIGRQIGDLRNAAAEDGELNDDLLDGVAGGDHSSTTHSSTTHSSSSGPSKLEDSGGILT